MGQPPLVSLIIPAYQSDATLGRCLSHLRAQDLKAFEVIVIDSSPAAAFADGVAEGYPRIVYEHAERRMLPHEARNRGAAKAAADLLIFTDPDVYPPPDWLSRLLACERKSGDLVVGSVACYGRKWLDLGAHLSKFDIWLPGGRERRVAIAPTVNLLVPRATFEAMGGFPAEYMIGDTVFSWKALEAGHDIWFCPQASVEHHHISTWSGLLHERFARGSEFSRVRSDHFGWSQYRIFLQLILSILPLRWLKLMARVLRNAWAARIFPAALWTLPVIATAQAAWLLGECRGLLARLSRRDSGR